MTMQVQNCFKIKEITSFGTKTPAPKEQDVRPRQLQPVVNTNFGETVDEAAVAAAYKIAEAENKSFVAAEAVKEAERVSKMAEDADAMLQLALGILEKCTVKGPDVDSFFPVLLVACFGSLLTLLLTFQVLGTKWCSSHEVIHNSSNKLMTQPCMCRYIACSHFDFVTKNQTNVVPIYSLNNNIMIVTFLDGRTFLDGCRTIFLLAVTRNPLRQEKETVHFFS